MDPASAPPPAPPPPSSAAAPRSSRGPLAGPLALLALVALLLLDPDAVAPLSAISQRALVAIGGDDARGGGAAPPCGPELELDVFILSQPGSARKRAAVRIASLSRLVGRCASHHFLLTRPRDAGEQRSLTEENSTHGDLRYADSAAEDWDLAKKVWLEVRAAAARANAAFLLKVDDDHMVFYDRLLDQLQNLPRERLLWGRRGSGAVFEGDPTVYTNNAYLMSADVVRAVADDAAAGTCLKMPGDDYCIGRSATGRGGAELIDDPRWFNDDKGDERVCLCRHWTLADEDALVVHHVRPQLLEAFARNKTLFEEMRFPDRNY